MTQSSPQRKQAIIACEKCRVLKVKCIRTGEGQPCTKSNIQCIYPEPRQPARVSKRAKPRLVDLESKLTNIIGLLSRSSAPLGGVQFPSGTDLEPPAIPGCSSALSDQPAEWTSQEYLPHSEGSEGPQSSTNHTITDSALEYPWDLSTTIDAAWVTNLGVGPVILDHLLDRFRSMASYFPFVRLTSACTAASMAKDRPFLLLAAVAAASSKYCHLQDALIRQLKESLSQRIIIAGEKDLDLLQGLLVHLAWFHFHFVPGSQQAFQYLQIAISMVIDLRLDQVAADLVKTQMELSDPYDREACRAYLGCYCMSVIIALSWVKPNNLRFHKDMLQCAMMLQQQPEFETDLLIYPMLKVLQFTEEVYETHQSEDLHSPLLYIHAERFTTWLEEWWSSLSTDLRNKVLLVNGYYTAKIRIQEMGLIYSYGQKKPPSSVLQEGSTILSTHPMIIRNLINCVSSAKEYLDCFLALPAAEHNSLPFSTWCQVVLTVFVLYKLSVGLPEVPQWNVKIAQQMVDLQEYLDKLLSHLQGIKPRPDRQIATKSLFSRLPEIIGSVRTSYMLTKEEFAQICDSHNAHPEFQALNNTSSSVRRLHRCPAVRYTTRAVTQVQDPRTLQSAITMEVQSIEDEQLWGNISFDGSSF
ncbi:hypothetical protein F1880_001719 [Penicillium rolfsii]|nr:hypothetical protein F1880_001719 [Penicillium rolfsii]